MMTDSSLKSVLYIEDNPTDVLLIQKAFAQSKLPNVPELRIVGSVEAAIAQLSQQFTNPSTLPALVLTDLRLPGKNGLQLLSWIRQQQPIESIPVVMLTGSAEDDDIDTAYKLGVNFCLIKPETLEGLVTIVQAISVYWIPPPSKMKL